MPETERLPIPKLTSASSTRGVVATGLAVVAVMVYGFLTDPNVMPVIYGLQFAAILGAHVLAVLLGLKLAGQGARPVAHLPMTVLMVAYTVLGLWLLSTARTG